MEHTKPRSKIAQHLFDIMVCRYGDCFSESVPDGVEIFPSERMGVEKLLIQRFDD